MTTARDLGQASMAAIEAMDRQAWLDLFAEDAVVEDPVGPSMFDPEGKGHRGPEAIAAFFDNVIAVNRSIGFDHPPVAPLRRRGGQRRRDPHHLRGRLGRGGRRGLRLPSVAGGQDRLTPGLLGDRRHPQRQLNTAKGHPALVRLGNPVAIGSSS